MTDSDHGARRARRTGHDRHASIAPRCATRSTGRPPRLLADAFHAFDKDDDHDVAVLTGAGGTFCAGADLKAISGGRGDPGARRGRRTDGPDPHAARQAGDRRGRGLRGRGRPRARAVVRPARRRDRRGVRRVLPPLGRAADRRRHGPAAAPDRPVARARPDPHRPRRLRRRGAAHGARQPPRPNRAARSRRRSASRKSSPRSRNAACAPIACRRTSSGTSRSPTRCATSTATAWRRSRTATRSKARRASSAAPDGTAVGRSDPL